MNALFASAENPVRVKSMRELTRIIYRQLPPSTWALLSGGVIGIAIMLNAVWG